MRIEEHRFYLSPQRSWWDACCARQVCDEALAPYPELALLGPYLDLVHQLGDERPHVDHPHLLARRPPLYFDGPLDDEPDLVYVDLVRAYWSIYTRTTLDVFYDGGSAPRKGLLPFLDTEELGQHKLLRNALLGLQHRQWRRGIDHGEHFREVVPPHRRRPDLWGLVMDVLELVAWDARNLGACYWHTDGGIFRHSDLAADFIVRLREAFGLTATIRAAGPGWVHALGSFKIGNFQTVIDHRSPFRVDSMVSAPHDLANCLLTWCKESA